MSLCEDFQGVVLRKFVTGKASRVQRVPDAQLPQIKPDKKAAKT
jgi:hypothetical protein